MNREYFIKDLTNYLRGYNRSMCPASKEYWKKHFDEIRDVLEKQIPKKPDIEGDGYADGHLVYDTWICPSCEERYEIDYDDYDYCPKCGQAIDKSFMDWSEEE